MAVARAACAPRTTRINFLIGSRACTTTGMMASDAHTLSVLIRVLSSSEGLRIFKRAFRENMLYKVQRYEELLERSLQEVKNAMDVIRIRIPDLKRAAGVTQSDTSNNWHIFESIAAPYHRAREQASQFEAILYRARARLEGTMAFDRVTSDDIIKEHRESLVAALRRLSTFTTQRHIVNNVVDIVTSFLKDPRLFRTRLMNFIMMGGAGTGKTTIAEAIGDVFAKAGMFVGNSLVQAGRGDLVGQYMGETVTKTRQFLMANLDNGVIFIDEAYAITSWEDGKPESYGTEATTAMVEFMTRFPGMYCIITAGYEREMIRYFLPANEGLDRRFPHKFVLNTLSPAQMVHIFKRQLLRAQGLTPPDDDDDALVVPLFTSAAYSFLECIIRVSTEGDTTCSDEQDPCTRRVYRRVCRFEPRWEYMYRVFEHQAGSMSNLADEAITVLYGTLSFRDVITSFKKRGRNARPRLRQQDTHVMREVILRRIRNMAFSDAPFFEQQFTSVQRLLDVECVPGM